MKNLRFCLAALLILLPAVARAQAPDPEEQYVRIFNIIQQADTLKANGQTGPALEKYRQARTNLVNFKRDNADWNPTAVNYRLNDVAQKISDLSGKTPGSSAAAAESSKTQVKLLEPGAEPRKALRLHPKPGDKQGLVMTRKVTMGMKMGAMENPPMNMPVMTLTVDSTVKNVSPDGDINWEVTITDFTVAEDSGASPVADTIKSAVGNLKGLSGAAITSSRGINKGLEMKLPSGSNAQAQQVLEQWKETLSRITPPLPQEAVGTGAKWEVRMPVKSQGITINQTDTYQLLSSEEDKLVLTNAVTLSAANQKIQNPAMPGMKTDLTKLTGSGGGTFTVDLNRVMPQDGEANQHSDCLMTVSAGGQKQDLALKLDESVQLAPK